MDKESKRIVYWVVGLLFAISTIIFLVNRANQATHLEDAVVQYEQFQDTYNTCVKLNKDLCNMRELDEKDVMFEQFSKAQRINTLKTQLNKWVEDYNAKSLMFGRALWKSNDLPYQLSTEQFNCYNN